MYRTLIADDEEMIRRGIARLLEADEEIEVVAQAEDGEMALEMAKEHLPDLLFVDINMPFMSGLEFIERLRAVRKDAVVVIVTGYDNFAYAQRALQLGVQDYLLKPVMEEPFYESLQKMKKRLASRNQQARYLDWAQHQLEKSRPTLLAAFLKNWLSGQLSEPEILEQFDYLGISVPEPFGVSIARLLPDDTKAVPGQAWDENLLYYAAENMAGELFDGLAPVTTCQNLRGDLVVLCGCEPRQAFEAAAASLRSMVDRHLPVNIDLLQGVAQSLEALPQVYEELEDRLKTETRYTNTVQQALEYMQQHLADSELSLMNCAKMLHISPQHLSRLFRQETGATFVDCLTKMRMRKAVELLGEREMKMYEIAERVGYSSQHYFSSAFKKLLGVSPQEYRKANV